MVRGCVCSDEEFSGDVLEENKSEWFEGVAPKGGREKEDMTRVMICKMKSACKGGEGLKVILQVRCEEEGLSEGVEGGVGKDKRVIEVGEGGGGKVMTKKELTLASNDGKFVVFGVISGAVEVVVDTKGAGEGGSGDGTIIKVDITGDGVRGDGL